MIFRTVEAIKDVVAVARAPEPPPLKWRQVVAVLASFALFGTVWVIGHKALNAVLYPYTILVQGGLNEARIALRHTGFPLSSAPPYGITRLTVDRATRCSVATAARVWAIRTGQRYAPIQQVTYGVAPPGFVADAPVQPLLPGDYIVRVYGYGRNGHMTGACVTLGPDGAIGQARPLR